MVLAQGAEVADLSIRTALALALGATIVLAALHLLAPHIRRLPLVPEDATGSFGGGLAVAYVFLHLLPEVARGSREVSEVLGDHFEPSPLLELGIFSVALAGFLLFYGLERLAQRTAARRASVPGGAQERAAGRVFALHLASYALYNGIIAYTLPTKWRVSPVFAVLFTIAIGLHFVLNDRGLEEHYGDRLDRRRPRLVLAAALLAGWSVGAAFAPTSALVVSVLIAFLAGGVLMNVFKEEVPSARRSSFRWFATGLVLYAALLALATGVRDDHTMDEVETRASGAARVPSLPTTPARAGTTNGSGA